MYLGLLLFWFVLHGKFTWEIFLLGLLICGGLFWFMCKFMGYSVAYERKFVKKIPFVIKYIAILFFEIIKANFQVMGMILSPKMEVKPCLHTFHSGLKDDRAKVVLSHSITLTPGTYTVQLEEDTFLIHALDKSLLDGIEASVFVKQLYKMEEEYDG